MSHGAVSDAGRSLLGACFAKALAVRKGTLNSVFAALIVAVATYMLIRTLGLI
jgi:uncharacterized protein